MLYPEHAALFLRSVNKICFFCLYLTHFHIKCLIIFTASISVFSLSGDLLFIVVSLLVTCALMSIRAEISRVAPEIEQQILETI